MPKRKKISLLILGITSILCSRAMFWFFDDPEGPNLLVVMGTATIVFFLSQAVYLFSPTIKADTGHKGLLLGIFAQIIIVAGLYFLLG